MSILNLFSLIGGLALFLYGMHILGESLAKLSGGKLESTLAKMTDNPLKGVLLGAGTTAVIQSSSATTVMVVGFVNSGIMQLKQAVGIIMGANVGTTITSWILSLSGIESDNLLIMLFKPQAFAPVLAMIGVILLMSGKSERRKDIGSILLGFSILMIGMDTMSSAMKPLKDIPAFTRLFLTFSNPLIGMLAGTVLTAIIQSSSASVGILQALCLTGTIPYSAVLPIIMGQNIGTCITALLSSIGATTNAKRAACIHLYFNMIGTLVFTTIFYILHAFFPFPFLEQSASPAGIAFIHSCFNIAATVILLPFSYQLVKLATISVKDKEQRTEPVLPEKLTALASMDKRFLDNPSFALTQCKKATGAMLSLAQEAANEALSLVLEYQEKRAEYIEELEDYVDQYETEINNYMFQISLYSLTETDSKELALLQHQVGNMERIADYSMGIAKNVGKMNKKKLHFSKDDRQNLEQYRDILKALIHHTTNYWMHPDPATAGEAFQLAHELKRVEKRILKDHKKRLKKGKCSVDMGFILSDILTGFQKVAEHNLRIMVQ